MKVWVGCLLLAFMEGLCGHLYAQTEPSSIYGKILTDEHLAVEAATVLLLRNKDSAIIRSAITNKTGFFAFYDLQADDYLVMVRKVGYNKYYSTKKQLLSGSHLNIGEITLIPFITKLAQVDINEEKDYIEQHSDKTILNIDNSIMAAGNSVYDILKIAPGVHITNDMIMFKGGQKALVTLNGKPFNLPDEQLAELLKAYQGSMVSQIELIDIPSAKYDAAGGGGVINIVLKKNKDIGLKESITESVAYGDKYKLNTGINVYFGAPKFNMFGTYFFSDRKTTRTWNINRDFFSSSQVINFDLCYGSTTNLKSHSFNYGANYDITSKQTIGVLFYGYDNPLSIDKHNTTTISYNGQRDSNIITGSNINQHINNLNYNLNYKGDFGSKSILSVDLDYSTYRRRSFELLQNSFFDIGGNVYRDPVIYTNNSPSQINVRAEKADYSLELSKTSSFNAGIKNSRVNSDNTIDFKQQINNTYQTVSNLTDHFVYFERINAAYANYSNKINKTSLSLGLRAEQTYSSGGSVNPETQVTRNYFNLFPKIELTQILNKNNQLALSYNRNITRPNYQDLNRFVAYIDQYLYSTGNPFLKPQYITTYQVSDFYLNKYKAMLSMIVTNDFYTTIFEQDNISKVYTTTKSNIGTRYQYIAELRGPIDINRWWNVNAYLKASYERYSYYLTSYKTTQDLLLQLNQNFSITSKLKAELIGSYESATYYGIKQYKPQYYLNAGIGYALFNDNGSIKLGVSDMFNTLSDRYYTHYLNLDLTGREKSASRFITTTFTYRFGRQAIKAASKRFGGNTDEQERMSGSGDN